MHFFGDATAAVSGLEQPSLCEMISFNEHYNISNPSFKEMMGIHHESTTLSEKEICDIEKSTRRQSSNEKWIKQKLYRITASNFYSAAVSTVEPCSKLNSMFYKSFTSAAIGRILKDMLENYTFQC